MEPENFREELKAHILETLAYCINCRFCLPSCPRFDITEVRLPMAPPASHERFTMR